MINNNGWLSIQKEIEDQEVTLVAVSKTKPIEDIKALYDLGQKDFGENYVQEMVSKNEQLPKDIRWHFIGHLQSNKVKMIAPFVHLIHGVDSYKLLLEIEKQAAKNNRVIQVLLQIHIAEEETKFGFDETSLMECLDRFQVQKDIFQHLKICGVMGISSLADDQKNVEAEFEKLNTIFKFLKASYFPFDEHFKIVSSGMSGDYPLALQHGSTMIRVGSLLFGQRG